MSDKLTTVKVERCVLHPLNRKRLGEMKEFTKDIADNGVEVPLIGRWLNSQLTAEQYPEHKGSQVFQVLAGARRLTAILEIGEDQVPIIERDLNDEEAFRFLMRENLHREDVHPLDEAEYFKQCTESGASVEMIAAEIGKSPSFVHKRLQLTQLTGGLQKLLMKGSISAAIAMDCARLPKLAQDELLKWIRDQLGFGSQEVGPNQVRQWISRNHVLKLSGTAFSPKDEKLWPAAGPCHTCQKRTGAVPSLFGDFTQADSCTDRRCYEQKANKHLDRQTTKLTAEGAMWVPISNTYAYQPEKEKWADKAIMQKQQWEECRKLDKGAFRALIVRSDDLAQLGRTLWALDRHKRDRTSYEQSPQQKAAAARAAREQKIQKHHRNLVIKQLIQTPVAAEQLTQKQIALAFFKRLWSDSQQRICTQYGWEVAKQKAYNGWDTETTARERIEEMTGPQVRQFINVLCVGHSLDAPWEGNGKKDELLIRAKAVGIDVAKLKREAVKKFPTKKQTAKKKGAKVAKKAS